MWVGAGVITSPLLNVDVVKVCKAVHFGIEPARKILQNHIEGHQVLQPVHLLAQEHASGCEVFKVLVIG